MFAFMYLQPRLYSNRSIIDLSTHRLSEIGALARSRFVASLYKNVLSRQMVSVLTFPVLSGTMLLGFECIEYSKKNRISLLYLLN